MIAIIDYDAGNLKSVEKALAYLGEESVITRDFHTIEQADKVILPGVGSFGVAMDNLKRYELDKVIHEVCERKVPFLGICLGLQLMFEGSEESEGVEGLGLLEGKIIRIPDTYGLKIPHMGWNSIERVDSHMFPVDLEGKYVYFVHSYYVPECKYTTAVTDYIQPFSAALHKDNFYATQFHLEKSGKVGESILTHFLNL